MKFIHKFVLQVVLAGVTLVGQLVQPAIADSVKLSIEGVNEPILSNVLAHLTYNQSAVSPDNILADNILAILPGADLPTMELSERKLQQAHHLAPSEIRQALQPFGYYSPVIESSLKRTGKEWVANYIIAPGPPTKIRKLILRINGEGAGDPGIAEAIDDTRLKTGSRLEHMDYETTKNQILEVAYNAGFLEGRFITSEIRVDSELMAADVSIVFDTGPRFYFGPVTVEQTVLKEDVIQRFVPFETGDPFNAELLVTMQLALEDSGYFREVDVIVAKDQVVDQFLPVTVKTELESSRNYTASAGYGTDTGPRVNIGVNFRRLNKSGHQFKANVQASEIGTTFHSQYLIPVNQGTTDQLAFSTKVGSEQIGDIDTDIVLGAISINENWKGFRRQIYTNIQNEEYNLGSGFQSSNLIIPGIGLSKLVADNQVFPRKGFSVNFDLHGATESVGSDASFLQGLGSIRGVWPVGDKGRLLGRASYGATAVDDFRKIPPSQRFFTGGDRTVRGYDYQSLASTNETGDRIGSQYLTTLSIEFDYLFFKNFGAAIFIDLGNASDDPIPELKSSAGIGVRYRSPIGMIRFDLAQPLEDEGDTVRFHVSIGADL